MADIVKEISDRAKQGMDIIDQGVLDKDLANKLKYEFAGTLVQSLFMGKGSSVTKITLIALYAVIACAGLVCLFTPLATMQEYKDYLIAISPLVGSLTTVYGVMSHLNKKAEKKYGNGNGGSRNLRPPKSYRPQYRDITKNVGDNSDDRPSDTKRDHPGR